MRVLTKIRNGQPGQWRYPKCTLSITDLPPGCSSQLYTTISVNCSLTSSIKPHEGREQNVHRLGRVSQIYISFWDIFTDKYAYRYRISSSSGLGLATVERLAALKAYVSILDRDAPPPELLSTPYVKYFSTDITNVDQIEAGVDSTVSWANETGATLGGVINCAGVGTAGKIIDAKGTPHPLDLWNFTLAVNLTGTFNLTRLALKHLINVKAEDGADGERGVIIMVSSAAAVSDLCGSHPFPECKSDVLEMS